MTFAIAGVSGNTGRAVAEALLAQGQKVRVIVRDEAKGAPWKERGAEVAIADLGDTKALTRALEGAEGAYLLIPPNYRAASYRDYQDVTARSVAAAVAESRVPHVVLLSSVGAQHSSGNGPIAGLHVAEQLLGKIQGTVLSSLRAAYFYENFASVVGSAKDAGVLPSFLPASLVVPMVSTRDIGRLAAELLLERPQKSQVVELGSGHSASEIAAALGRVLGTNVRIEEAPISNLVPALTGAGLPKDLAELYAEMTAGFIDQSIGFERAAGIRRVESKEALDRVASTLLGRN